ncbi:hypothetical protein PGT21_013775 [Puccinia graminis f. sp. tritici]|uniref:Uncharacterized protein n=1 Tax=Puccinia graminis f. sp. tritici TaxID=56615 RepID=A0A5B0PU09_PUCGR|nr:hypothetical protein PGT21_013775 [Puccinia graminis f. sp. tritici]
MSLIIIFIPPHWADARQSNHHDLKNSTFVSLSFVRIRTDIVMKDEVKEKLCSRKRKLIHGDHHLDLDMLWNIPTRPARKKADTAGDRRLVLIIILAGSRADSDIAEHPRSPEIIMSGFFREPVTQDPRSAKLNGLLGRRYTVDHRSVDPTAHRGADFSSCGIAMSWYLGCPILRLPQGAGTGYTSLSRSSAPFTYDGSPMWSAPHRAGKE